MRYSLLTLTLILLAIFVFTLLVKLTPRGGLTRNSTSVLSQSFDAGEIRAGRLVYHTFRVLNSTGATLKFVDVKKSCGCVLAGAFPSALADGQAVDIGIKVDTHGMYGRFSQKVIAEVERHPPIILSISGTAVASHPQLVNFGQVLKGAGATEEIEIKAFETEPVTISDLQFDREIFEVEILPSPSNSRDQLMRVSLRPDVPYGYFHATLRFKQRADAVDRNEIRLRGYVAKLVEAEPSRVLFGVLGAGETTDRTIRVFSPYGENVTVRNVVPGERLTCATPKTIDGQIEIPVTLSGGFDSSIFQGAVRIEAETGGKTFNLEVECYAMRAEK